MPPTQIRTRAGTADQASEHVLSLAVTHATTMLSRQSVGVRWGKFTCPLSRYVLQMVQDMPVVAMEY